MRYFLLTLSAFSARAQAPTPPPTGDVLVGGHGVLRWQKIKREVARPGVTYTAPFAYSYRALARLGQWCSTSSSASPSRCGWGRVGAAERVARLRAGSSATWVSQWGY